MTGRKKLLFTSVGTSYLEKESPGWPDRFRLTRVSVQLLSGAGDQVGLAVRQRSEPTLLEDTPLEIDLTVANDSTVPFDFQLSPGGVLVLPIKRREIDIASVFVAVKVDSGTGNRIQVVLEFEF